VDQHHEVTWAAIAAAAAFNKSRNWLKLEHWRVSGLCIPHCLMGHVHQHHKVDRTTAAEASLKAVYSIQNCKLH
jgi:hypothetical protein